MGINLILSFGNEESVLNKSNMVEGSKNTYEFFGYFMIIIHVIFGYILDTNW